MSIKKNPFANFKLRQHRIKVYGRMYGYSHAVMAKKMRNCGLQLVWEVENATHVFIGEKLGKHRVPVFIDKPIIRSRHLREYFREQSNSYLKTDLELIKNLKKLLFSTDSKSRALFLFYIEQEDFLPPALDIPLFTLSLVPRDDDFFPQLRKLQMKYGRDDLVELCKWVLSKVKENGRVKEALTKTEYAEVKQIMKSYKTTWPEV